MIITILDFKKAYNSVGKQAVFDTQEELGVDRKTRDQIHQTLMKATSKVKFLGEISEPFKLLTGIQQVNGLNPLLFNLVLGSHQRRGKSSQRYKQ